MYGLGVKLYFASAFNQFDCGVSRQQPENRELEIKGQITLVHLIRSMKLNEKVVSFQGVLLIDHPFSLVAAGASH